MGDSTMVILGIVSLFAGLLVWPLTGWINAKAEHTRAKAESQRAATEANKAMVATMMKGASPAAWLAGGEVQLPDVSEPGIIHPGHL